MDEQLKAFQASMTNMLQEAFAKNIPELVKKEIEEVMGNTKRFSLMGKSEEDIQKMDMKSKALHFVSAVVKGDMETLSAMKALSVGSDSNGGFLVPEEWSSEISRIARDVGLLRKLGRSVGLDETMNFPKADGNVSVYWPGENAAGTESTPAFGSVEMKMKECVGLATMSSKLLAKASVDLISYLTDIFVEALVREEDNQAFNGVGSPFTGVLNNTDVNVRLLASGTGFSNVTAADLLNMQGDISTGARRGAAYFMSYSVWLVVRQLLQNSQYLTSFATPTLQSFGDVMQPLAPVGAIDGRPVYVTDVLPETSASASATKFIAFGNVRYINLGLNPQLKITVSTEGVVGGVSMFERNMSAFRIIQEKSIAVMHGEAFSVLKTN